jgi:2-iminobutanoate/2-iminopropanoate deaminase
MASKISFNTGKVPRLNTFIPQAVIAGGLIYVSGTAGILPETGKLIDDTFEGQARQAFTNIQTILEEAGSNMDNIVKTTIWMVSGQDQHLPPSIKCTPNSSPKTRRHAAPRR